MRISGTILSLLLFIFTAPSAADIVSMKIRSHHYRDFIELSEFRFSDTGFISIAISSVTFFSLSVSSNLPKPDPSRVGLYLISNELLPDLDESNESCDLDSNMISVLFTLQDLAPPSHSSFNKTYPVTYPGVYSLSFTNCNELSSVTMDVRAEFYNTDHNNLKDYLPAGLTQLPSLYLRFSIIYACLLSVWILVCMKIRRHVSMSYLLMGMLLLATAIQYRCAAAVQQHVKVTGTQPHGLNVLFYIFQFMSNELFFLVMFFGLCWICNTLMSWVQICGWVGFLTILMVCANIASIDSSIIYSHVFEFLVNLLVCFFVSVSLAIPLRTQDDPVMFLLLLVFVVYLIFTNIVYLLNLWAYNVAKEIGRLVVCMVMFCMVTPYDVDHQDEKTVELDEEVGQK